MLVLGMRTAAGAGLLCRALPLSSRSSSLEPRCPWAVAMTLPVLDCLLDERARSSAVRCLTKRDYCALPLGNAAGICVPVWLVARRAVPISCGCDGATSPVGKDNMACGGPLQPSSEKMKNCKGTGQKDANVQSPLGVGCSLVPVGSFQVGPQAPPSQLTLHLWLAAMAPVRLPFWLCLE